jgi:hypothetical protein
LDTLSTGHLSHNVIGPGQINSFIHKVTDELQRNYYGYEMVMTKVQEYYDLPIVSFAYQEGLLLINIPIYIKPIQQKLLTLYSVRTVPVPFHIRHEHDIDPTQNQNSYTWYKPTKEVLGMSDTNFISLNMDQLDTCVKHGNTYLCEGLMLMRQSDTHNCESAIFWDLPPEVVKQKCKFHYYKRLVPEPTILDTGNEVLLAGLPLPWKFLCNHDQEIPQPLTGAKYAIIAKKDLCLCSISAGDYFLQENIIACQGDSPRDRNFQLKFTINNAVKIFFPDKFKNFVPFDIETNLVLEPYPDQVIDLDIIATPDDDVLEQYEDGVDMQDLVNKIEEHGQAYIHQVEKIGAIPDMTTWFTGKHMAFGLLLILGCLAVVALGVGAFLWYKHKQTASTIKGVSFQMSKMIPTAAAMVSQLPYTEAAVTEDELKQLLEGIQESFTKVISELEQSPLNWRFCTFTFMMFGVIALGYLITVVVHALIKWTYVNWLLSPTYKSATCGDRLWIDQTDIYLEFSNRTIVNQAVHLYLGSVEGYPPQLTCKEHKNKVGGFSYINNTWFDTLNISWNNMHFKMQDERFWAPSCIQIPIFKKRLMRRMMRIEETKYQIYLKYDSEIRILSGHYSVNIFGDKTESELKEECRKATDVLQTTSKIKTKPSNTQLTSKTNNTKAIKKPRHNWLDHSDYLHGDQSACSSMKPQTPEPHIVPEFAEVLYKA